MENKQIFEMLFDTAKKNINKDEVPVSCIIVNKKNNQIIAKSTNNRRKKYSVLGHAEINAIEEAEKKIKDWRLNECNMYVSLKPCEMCQIIIEKSRINHVYYLLDREKTKTIINNMTELDCLKIKKEYRTLLSDFFKSKR